MASRKRYTTAEVLKQLDLSEDEQFDDNDSDRESDTRLDDVEPVSDADSETTEVYNASLADAGNESSETDSEPALPDAAMSTDDNPSVPIFTPRVWERIDTNNTPKVDFEYGHTAGLNSSIHLNAESRPIEFFELFLTDEVWNLMVNE